MPGSAGEAGLPHGTPTEKRGGGGPPATGVAGTPKGAPTGVRQRMEAL
jgi:hypothetical protein